MFNQHHMCAQKIVSCSTSVNMANLLLVIIETSDGHQLDFCPILRRPDHRQDLLRHSRR